MSKGALLNLSRNVRRVEQNNIPGILIEAGCALGGSAIMIGLAKSRNRRLNVYDVFGMIPPPSGYDGNDVHHRYRIIKEGKSKGINGELYYGYEQDILQKVKKNFLDFGLNEKDHIHLIGGLYDESLLIGEPVAFAHIDCDWYASVMTCLKRIEPNLSPGGIMIIDDYNDWSGCKRAVDEFFRADDKEGHFSFKIEFNKLVIEKTKGCSPA